jgi:hypothetical protein
MNLATGLLAAGPIVASLGVIVGPVFCGLAFAVLSMGSYNGVREDLNNPRPNPGHAISRGYSHLLMCSVLFSTLFVISPLLGPFAPVIPGLFAGFMVVTVLAALCNGGYAHLHATWGNSKKKPLLNILWFIDTLLSFIPSPVKKIFGEGLSRLHPWLGPIFFTLQMGLFLAIAIVASPALGIAGLSYIALEFARTQNKLPMFLGRFLEKFRSVMEVVSGFFTNSNLLHLYALYKLASAVLLSMLSAKTSKTIATEAPSQVIVGKAENVSPSKFARILELLPKYKISTALHKEGLGHDVDNVFNAYERYLKQHRESVLASRKKSYDAFAKLQHSVSKLDKLKYYLGFVPMNLKYYLPINYYYNPAMFNRFAKDHLAQQPLSVTTSHMQHGQVSIPKPAAVDFQAFINLISEKINAKQDQIEDIKPVLNNLVNFKELVKTKLTFKEKDKLQEELSELARKKLDLNRLQRTFTETHQFNQ